jgi:hypothetical protein
MSLIFLLTGQCIHVHACDTGGRLYGLNYTSVFAGLMCGHREMISLLVKLHKVSRNDNSASEMNKIPRRTNHAFNHLPSDGNMSVISWRLGRAHVIGYCMSIRSSVELAQQNVHSRIDAVEIDYIRVQLDVSVKLLARLAVHRM